MDKTDVALRQREIYKVTLAGSVVNIVLTLCKFAAGILGRSAAMVADAVHSLSDLATDVIVLVFVRISGKPEDKGHDYGHGKYETFATLLIGVALLVVGIGILWSGGERIYAFFRGETLDQPGWIALAAALVSIVSKEVLFQYTRRHWYRGGNRRSYPAGRRLAGARPLGGGHRELLHHPCGGEAIGSVPG